MRQLAKHASRQLPSLSLSAARSLLTEVGPEPNDPVVIHDVVAPDRLPVRLDLNRPCVGHGPDAPQCVRIGMETSVRSLGSADCPSLPAPGDILGRRLERRLVSDSRVGQHITNNAKFNHSH